jgi:hypothetical protein
MAAALTQVALEKIRGQLFIRDGRVTAAGARSWVLEWWAKGRSHRMTLGRLCRGIAAEKREGARSWEWRIAS